MNRQGQLVVVDNKASCIFVFHSQSGKLIHKFGSRGAEQDQLAGPHYVAVNSKGNIVLSDFHNHSIKVALLDIFSVYRLIIRVTMQIFDSSGDFLFSFGSNGEGNGQFNAPTGVAVDDQDNILVADWGNSRIQIFDSQVREKYLLLDVVIPTAQLFLLSGFLFGLCEYPGLSPVRPTGFGHNS